MISVQNLSKSFGSLQAISNVTFSIEQGKLCGLVGPNGAGKSTLFKLIMGMLEPNNGEIHIANEKVQFGDTDYKNQIGFVPENPALYEYLTGSEFLTFVAIAKKMPIENRQAEIQNWLEFFHLTTKSGELIKSYSHGMRRKISLCSALIGSPQILLLDEATNGLDPEASFKFKEYLKTYCQNHGTVLFSSHIIETVEHLCDRIIILHQGKVRQELNRTDWEDLRKQGSSLEQLFISVVQGGE
ncbi:ABC transporter ATP-binding protein [candidate division KSB1 bacterium]|nr:ABC transporter ATP-binding protein [candidate division KSB1 bacterium]